MPRLPDSTDLGRSPAPQSRRGIVSAPRDARFDAMSELGNTMNRVGQEMQDRQDKMNFAVAKTDYLKSKINIEAEFDNDNDYQTYGARYKDKITKARGDAAKVIRNPEMRKAFELETDLDIEQGFVSLGKKAFAKEADAGRAGLTSVLDENQNLILATKDPSIRESAYKNVNNAIDMAMQNNYIDREAGINLKRKFAQESALREFGAHSAQDQLAMLKNKHPSTQFIPADQQKQLADRAESSLIQQSLLNKRLDKIARAERYDRIADTLEQANGDISAIPAQQFLSLSSEQQDRLREKGHKLASGKYNVTDMTKYHDLKHLAANPATREAFLDKDLDKELDDFAPAERKEIINLQAKLNSKDPETEQILDGYRSISQRLNDSLIDAGDNPFPAKGSEDAKSLALLRGRIEKGIIAEKVRTGKKELSADEEQAVIDRELIKDKKSTWFGLGSKESFIYKTQLDDIPDDDQEQIKAALKELGQEPSEQNILRLYIQERMRNARQ